MQLRSCRRLVRGVVWSVTLAMTSSAALAADRSEEDLLKQGVDARKRRDDATAFALFKEAYSIQHSPRAAAQMGLAVTGSNFAANATVSVFIGSATGTPLGTGTTNAAGTLTAGINVTVPSLAGGEQPLIVSDNRSQFPITLSFRVQ